MVLNLDSRELYEEMIDLQKQDELYRCDILDIAETQGMESDSYEDAVANYDAWREDYGHDLQNLTELAFDIGEDVMRDGVYLIHEDNIEDYAQDYIYDLYEIDEIPYIIRLNINWSGVTQDLLHDMSVVTFRGADFYYMY